MADHVRVSVLVRPLDIALSLVRWFLVPAIALGAAAPAIVSISDSATTSPAWVLGGGGVALAGTYALLLQTDEIGGRMNRMIAAIRMRVALACNHSDAADHSVRKVACFATPPMLRAPLFRYDAQRDAVARLTDACRTGPSGSFWFIEGESGSGKSRSGLLLIHSLARSVDLATYASNAYVYDFAAAEDVQDSLLRRLGGSRHRDAVVIVDNFHRVRADVLRRITSILLDQPGPMCERMLVFLAQPASAWRLSPGSDVRIVSDAKAGDRHVRLMGPSAEAITREVSTVDPAVSDQVRDLQVAPIASAMQLHVAQVIARNHAVPPDVETVILLLSSRADPPPAGSIVRFLAVVTALSAHRGMFSRRAFTRSAADASKGLSTFSRWAEVGRLHLALRRMRRIGFVPRVRLNGQHYVLHESIAESCIDRLSVVEEFRVTFERSIRRRLDAELAANDDLAAWFLATEIGDLATMARCFDSALFGGAYAQMARCLTRLERRRPLAPKVQLELAILLDRVGEFEASRRLFDDQIAEDIALDRRLTAIFLTSRVETSHDSSAINALGALERDGDRLETAVAQYWRLHVAGHAGSFAPDRLLTLAANAMTHAQAEERTHWATYEIGRMQFDSMRHLYLSGRASTSEMQSLARREIDDFLRPSLPTFEALRVLYREAHLIGHVFLPQMAIFNETVALADAESIGLRQQDLSGTDALGRAMLATYARARDEFWQLGDREANYLQADLLNAQMVQAGVDLEAMYLPLHEYKAFIRAAGFADLFSYPHLYFARFHALSHYSDLFESRPSNASFGHHQGEALRHLHDARDLDLEVGNAYGVLRADLLIELIESMTRRPGATALRNVRSRADEAGYQFERRLADHLLDRAGLTPAELRSILRYYPIVHQ